MPAAPLTDSVACANFGRRPIRPGRTLKLSICLEKGQLAKGGVLGESHDRAMGPTLNLDYPRVLRPQRAPPGCWSAAHSSMFFALVPEPGYACPHSASQRHALSESRRGESIFSYCGCDSREGVSRDGVPRLVMEATLPLHLDTFSRLIQ